MSRGPAIGLIDGEHHPAAVRESLDRLDGERGVAAVVFCGGEEKLRREVLERPEVHYGRAVAVEDDAAAALRRAARESAAATVVDLADEPVLTGARRLRLAALALSLGLDYEAPGTSLRAPRYERLGYAGPKLAVIATGKRTGKTALAGHWAMLLRERGLEPVIVCMGRGGPAEPQLAEPGISLEELVAIAEEGRHAASDYLEGAMLAGVTTVGCRRVGGGLAGEPHASNVSAGARLAAERSPGAIVFESSGACVPPVQVDRTLCLVREREEALGALGPYRIMRAGLALVMDPAEERLAAEVADFCPGPVMRCALRPEPAEELPGDARVALFSRREIPPWMCSSGGRPTRSRAWLSSARPRRSPPPSRGRIARQSPRPTGVRGNRAPTEYGGSPAAGVGRTWGTSVAQGRSSSCAASDAATVRMSATTASGSNSEISRRVSCAARTAAS